jgi:hypothetical protein
MQKLYDMFEKSPDELVEGITWKIYNTKLHNKLVTSDYGALPTRELPDLDDAEVISRKLCGKCMKVYVKYEGED